MITGEPDVLITKTVNSCFYGEPDLHAWLQERGIHPSWPDPRDHHEPLLRDHRPDGPATSVMTCSS